MLPYTRVPSRARCCAKFRFTLFTTLVTMLVAAALTVGCASKNGGAPIAQVGDPASSSDVTLVDCKLPAQVRRLTRTSAHITPSQIIRTSAADCQKRGGTQAVNAAAN